MGLGRPRAFTRFPGTEIEQSTNLLRALHCRLSLLHWGFEVSEKKDQERIEVIVKRPPAGPVPAEVRLGLSSLATLIAHLANEDETERVGVPVLVGEGEDP